jgi:MFS family permease
VGLVVVATVRDTPEEIGQRPDGDEVEDGTNSTWEAASSGATMAEAVRTPFFWSISLGCACMLFVNSSIIFHIVPFLDSRGESTELGATLLSFQVFLIVPIVLISAWAADRIGGTTVLVAMMLLTVAGVFILMAANSVPVYVLASVFLAFGGSNWAILWAVLGRMYGRRHYNSIRMSVYSILIGGMAGAPLLAGFTYDETGSYDLLLKILVGVGFAGAALFVVTVKTEGSAREGHAAAVA